MEFCEEMANLGKTIIVAALDGTFQRKVIFLVYLLMETQCVLQGQTVLFYMEQNVHHKTHFKRLNKLHEFHYKSLCFYSTA